MTAIASGKTEGHSDELTDDFALLVDGGRPLHSGTIATSGFKHSLVTVVAAATAARAPVTIDNCPDIVESTVLADIVRGCGGSAQRAGGTLEIDCTTLTGTGIPPQAAARIHGAVYLLPALLARHGRVTMPVAGGCRIGDGERHRRPVEQYASVLARFGARVRVGPSGEVVAEASRLRGCAVDLLDYTADRRLMTGPLYSGATKMALLTAAVAEGTSTLRHPYPKSDVSDAVDVLRELGADIERAPDGTLTVRGRGPGALSRACRHSLVPDLIEIVTWICAGATAAAGPLHLTGPGIDRAVRALAPETAVLERMGIQLEHTGHRLTVTPGERPRPVRVTVASHGVFSDSQPFLALLAAHATGTSAFTETVWGGRFGQVPGLVRLGVDARVHGRTLRVHGPSAPHRPGQRVTGTDLRAAAVLLLAALTVPGPTVIGGAGHLARGYPDLPRALRALGAAITTATTTERSC